MIFVAIPNLRWISTQLALTLPHWMKNYGVTVFAPEMLKPIGYARNYCVKKFLETKATHFLFIDADVAPEPGVLEKLLTANVDVIAAKVNVMKVDVDGIAKPVPILCRRNASGEMKIHFGKGVERIDRAGTGCMLIKRSVFETIKCPWFESKDWGEVRGTDFNFCEKMEKAGIPLFGHFDAAGRQLVEGYI